MNFKPSSLKGTHKYSISPNGKFAHHTFSNFHTLPAFEFISMPDHKPLIKSESIIGRQDSLQVSSSTEFFKITIPGNIVLDGWMAKPKNFDPTKKFPVLFYVYSEPASSTVQDFYGTDQDFLYEGDLAEDGYIYVSVDNRGTPSPRGREWRKSIYRKVGRINITDQALAAGEMHKKWSFMDPGRVAVWG